MDGGKIMSENKSNGYQRIRQKPRCMCVDCRHTGICRDENGGLFAICCNRKSENFLKEISLFLIIAIMAKSKIMTNNKSCKKYKKFLASN